MLGSDLLFGDRYARLRRFPGGKVCRDRHTARPYDLVAASQNRPNSTITDVNPACPKKMLQLAMTSATIWPVRVTWPPITEN